MRSAGLLLAVVFVALFCVSTVAEIAVNGFDVISATALLIAALFVVGLLGAIRHPPR